LSKIYVTRDSIGNTIWAIAANHCTARN